MWSGSQISELAVKRLHEKAILPTRTHADDAGMDLYCLENFEIKPGNGLVARTGIAMALPAGFVGMVVDRSSMAKRGLKTAGGIIDAGYRGEIHIILRNLSNESQYIDAGSRIAQLMVVPIVTPVIKEVSELDETARGSKGFGSSGK